MAEKLVTTWYLDYQGPALELPQWPAEVMLMEAEIPSPELSQFLFCAVGTPWHWFSRLSWTYQDWLHYFASEQVRTWVLYQRGTPVGFVELRKTSDESVELKFFGLMPSATGQGLGPALATAAAALAQQWQASRVWVHTCSEDHPAALATYQRAGFVVMDTITELEEVPSDYASAALCAPFVESRLQLFAPN
jgi:ribosomal protein S18 acetylase RimI-like enzyme